MTPNEFLATLFYARAKDAADAGLWQMAAEEYGYRGNGGMRSLCLDMATLIRRGANPSIITDDEGFFRASADGTQDTMLHDGSADHEIFAPSRELRIAVDSTRQAATSNDAGDWDLAAEAWDECKDEFFAKACRSMATKRRGASPLRLKGKEAPKADRLAIYRGNEKWAMPHLQALMRPLTPGPAHPPEDVDVEAMPTVDGPVEITVEPYTADKGKATTSEGPKLLPAATKVPAPKRKKRTKRRK